MTVYVIEGEWSGYRSSQRRVVHREYTTSKERAEQIERLAYIFYSDGTRLDLYVREKLDRKKREPISGYTRLINDCLRYGVNTVNEVVQKQKNGAA